MINWLPTFVLLPLGTAILMPILYRIWKGFPDIIANLVTGCLAAFTLYCIRFTGQSFAYHVGGWEPVNGIAAGITMVWDGLACVMLLIVNVIAFASSIYSIGYMTQYTDKGKYYTLFLLMLTGLNGVVLSGDLFNIFVFLEITAIASYALVAFGVEAEELEASFKYQVLGGLASMIILLSIAFFYHLSGTLNLADAASVLASQGGSLPLYFTAVLILIGLFIKTAIIPFHAWLPDAHPSAPAPISAMLSGVVIKVLGMYVLIRLFFNVFGLYTLPHLQIVLYVLGGISMVLGALLATGQNDLKRLLAYSSISQMGYVIIAFGLGTPLGILGGLFHMMNHAVFKSLLFLTAGSIQKAFKHRDINKMNGILDNMPITGSTHMIGAFSISGLPPFGGFWSKVIIVLALLESQQYLLAVLAVLTSILTLAYYIKVQKRAFWGKSSIQFMKLSFSMGLPVVILALMTLIMGVLLIPSLKSVLLDPAVQVLKNGTQALKIVVGG